MRKTALVISAVSAAMAVAIASGVATGSAATGTAQVTAITHAFSGSEVSAARGYWTKARMLSAISREVTTRTCPTARTTAPRSGRCSRPPRSWILDQPIK